MLKLLYTILLVIIFSRSNLFCSNIYNLRLFILEMPYHKKRKTDGPPRELILEDLMKAACAAVLDGKPVNVVARECGVTHMTLEQCVRKSELLQTSSVDQFMPQLKFSQMRRRERCPIIFYVRQSFTTASLGKQPGSSKNMLKLILTDYISATKRGTNVKTGHQPFG